MRRSVAVWACLLALSAAVAGATDIEPRLFVDDEGRLTLIGLPAILDDPEVRRHLSSGLTTSVLVRVRAPRPFESGASRIDIRLELWDEVFLVSLIDGEGTLSELSHPSPESLRSWWSEVDLILSSPASALGSSPGNARLFLDVVPFSQAELMDTQRWLAESMGGVRSEPGVGGSRGASRAVSALIATSIQRRSVRSWSWTVPVEKLERP